MYLFFDSNGTLKEQITTSPVRYGDENVNKIYAYWDTENVITNSWCILRKPNGDNTETIYGTVTSGNENDIESFIPYDPERDLKFFKYNTPYKFCVFEIPSEVFNEIEGINIYSVLGSIYITYNSNQSLKPMGLFAFAVEPSTLSVATDQNINIAQWNELMLKLSDAVLMGNVNQNIDGIKLFLKTLKINGGMQINSSHLEGLICEINYSTNNVYGILVDTDGTPRQVALKLPNTSGTIALKSDITNAMTPTFITATSTSQVVFDETSRNSFKFEIGSNYNGVYVFTFNYLMMLVPIYNLTNGQIYKFAGPGVQDWNTGSIINSLYNMKRDGNYLYIWSGKTEYQLAVGVVGTLGKIKLY